MSGRRGEPQHVILRGTELGADATSDISCPLHEVRTMGKRSGTDANRYDRNTLRSDVRTNGRASDETVLTNLRLLKIEKRREALPDRRTLHVDPTPQVVSTAIAESFGTLLVQLLQLVLIVEFEQSLKRVVLRARLPLTGAEHPEEVQTRILLHVTLVIFLSFFSWNGRAEDPRRQAVLAQHRALVELECDFAMGSDKFSRSKSRNSFRLLLFCPFEESGRGRLFLI